MSREAEREKTAKSTRTIDVPAAAHPGVPGGQLPATTRIPRESTGGMHFANKLKVKSKSKTILHRHYNTVFY